MLWKKVLLLQIQIILTLQLITADEVSVEELMSQIRSHLGYTARRLKHIQLKVSPKHANDLQNLLERYTNAAKATDPVIEEKLVLDFENKQNEEFKNYLTLEYDEQFLEVDIRIQEWSMRELLTQVNGNLATEIERILPAYEKAATSKDFQKKYDAFSEIQDAFSNGLWDLLDAKPVDKSLTNVQLKFFKEFLLYLQEQDDSKEYAEKLKTLLGEVDKALTNEDMQKKFEVMAKFDDVSTKYGRYLDNKIIEFEFDKFM
ncbi:uncharacterized protein [Eurosta solidaginis]|uniref:uncharacterized protein n=1 Tax=Eurosta solidaginis TaxID=178769 RepID=UPI003530998E